MKNYIPASRLLTKLIELKAELDTPDKRLTFKVIASNDLIVEAYPYFRGYICYINLNKITEEAYNYVVNSIRTEFTR